MNKRTHQDIPGNQLSLKQSFVHVLLIQFPVHLLYNAHSKYLPVYKSYIQLS